MYIWYFSILFMFSCNIFDSRQQSREKEYILSRWVERNVDVKLNFNQDIDAPEELENVFEIVSATFMNALDKQVIEVKNNKNNEYTILLTYWKKGEKVDKLEIGLGYNPSKCSVESFGTPFYQMNPDITDQVLNSYNEDNLDEADKTIYRNKIINNYIYREKFSFETDNDTTSLKVYLEILDLSINERYLFVLNEATI